MHPTSIRCNPGHARFTPWLLLVALLSVMPLERAAAELSPAQIAEIQNAGQAALENDALPGLAIGIAQGTRTWSFGFGKADLENDVAVSTRSMFRTASISKWLTATAALRLVEQRKLDLDSPIQSYCPQYPQKAATLTSRHLLSHLSGIRHYHGANGEPRATEEQRRTLDELARREQSTQYTRYTDRIAPLAAFKDEALLFQPGARFNYTSLGYRVLGCVLEGAAKMSYSALMRELVFTPAGMTTIAEDDARSLVPHRVAGYAKENGVLVRAAFRDTSENLPAGGHLATAEELVRFAAAFNAGKLVQAATRERMSERPKLNDGSSTPFMPTFFGLGPQAYYGQGVFVASSNGEMLLIHTGAQAGTSTELLLAPASGVAVAVLVNMNNWNSAHALATQILAIVKQQR